MAEARGDAWLNPEHVEMPKGLPTPQLWRMLVAPVQPARRSRGGIELPDIAMDNIEHLTYIGKVMNCGPVVGKKPEWARWPRWASLPIVGAFAKPRYEYNIKPGDWVVFGRYAGMRIEYQGVKLVLLDDDAVLAKCDGPDGFRIYV